MTLTKHKSVVFNSITLAAILGSSGLIDAAVTRVSPAKGSNQPATVATPNSDDWFAEIDDMIQDIAVQMDLPEQKKDQLLIKSSTVKKVGRAPMQPANAKITFFAQASKPSEPTSTGQSTITSKSSSIIQDILRSDYWLEDSKKPAKKTTPKKKWGPVRRQVIQEETTIESIPTRTTTKPKSILSTDTELLALEQDLLRDLSVNTRPTPTAEPKPPKDTNTGTSLVEADVMQINETLSRRRNRPKESEEMAALEASLMAELDDFETPNPKATPVANSVNIADEQPPEASLTEMDILLAELAVAQEATPTEVPTERPPQPELDAALELAEKAQPIATPIPKQVAKPKITQPVIAPEPVVAHAKMDMRERTMHSTETTPNRKGEVRKLAARRAEKLARENAPPPKPKQYKMNMPMISLSSAEATPDTSVFMMVAPSEEASIRITSTPAPTQNSQNAVAIIPAKIDNVDASVPVGW